MIVCYGIGFLGPHGIPLAFSDKYNYNVEISNILREGGFFYGERTYG